MFCKECGAEIPDDSKHCKECGASLVDDPVKTKPEVTQSNVPEKESFFQKNKKVLIGCCIGIIVIFLLSGVANLFFGDSPSDQVISNGMDDVNVSESDFKGMCKEIDYKKLSKNSDKFYGDRVVASGKVVQIMEEDDGGIIRLATDGEYDDIVAVVYSGTNDVVEDDYITVYGYIFKDYSYESQANFDITIPCIEAKYIDK